MEVTPMLAASNGSQLPSDPDAWVMEPKLDGWRFMVHITATGEVVAYTRTLKSGHTLHGLNEQFAAMFPPDTILDGEVVVPGKHSTDVPRVLANPRAGTLHFYAFDVMRVAGHDTRQLSWTQRRKLLEVAFAEIEDGPIRIVMAVEPDQRVIDAWLALDMEGAILKRRSSTYKGGRSRGEWIKYKPQMTVDLRIVGFEEGAGKRRGQAATVKVIYNGSRIPATVADWDLARDMWNRPEHYLGHLCEVAYHGPTSLGYLRHPVMTRMRPDIDEAA